MNFFIASSSLVAWANGNAEAMFLGLTFRRKEFSDAGSRRPRYVGGRAFLRGGELPGAADVVAACN
ncbi:hypothetical protein GGD66_000659 [Bradyrhizobium sp. CIR48]|uniref:hypothetical protein n=1 Tax=Bradyrhizobium sp. CIR48 TaxID=2663840 RepID=UPI001605B2A0|nr:hypothetical protein [Bradyrhizobium sp. CIR48]MBB4422133.1 hypothetical protein [Bradyrhizobium sp. CIR48]